MHLVFMYMYVQNYGHAVFGDTNCCCYSCKLIIFYR